MSVATVIADQIGRKALYMIGAKNLMDTGKGPDELGGLCFKIMRNEKRVTHLKISLDASDLYTVKALKQHRAPSHRVETLEELSGVYFDMLHDVIAGMTGLALSL